MTPRSFSRDADELERTAAVSTPAAEAWSALERTATMVRTQASVGVVEQNTGVTAGRAHRGGALMASGLLALGGLSASQAGAAPAAHAMASNDAQLFSLTNQDRTSNGVPAAQWNNTLGGIGESQPYGGCGFGVAGRAQDMINRQYFAHPILNCNNQLVFSMFQAAGLQYGWAGENIGWNNYGDASSSVVAADQAFMNSPEHRANILNANYTHMGMGSAFGGFQGNANVSMYTEEFIQATAPLPAQNPPTAVVPPPTMNGLPGTESSTSFTISWAASAAASPTYTLWVDENGQWFPWTQTTGTSASFIGTAGQSYSFAVEVSGSGYDSGRPTTPSVGTTVAGGAPNSQPFKGLYGLDVYGALRAGNSAPLNTSDTWNWNIARAVALNSTGQGGYVLDGFGGLHAFGNAPPSTDQAGHYWPGFDAARGLVLRADGSSGYVLDLYGGLHPFGGAPDPGNQSGHYWPWGDVAKGVALRNDGSGYVLDSYGGLHAFGGAPDPGNQSGHYWPGFNIARGLTLTSTGGYVLDGYGGLHPFGGAPDPGDQRGHYWAGWDIARGVAWMPGTSAAGWLVDGYGGFHPFGGAPNVLSFGYTPGADLVKSIAAR